LEVREHDNRSATLKVQQPRKLSLSLWSIYTPPSGHKFKAAMLKASLQQPKQPKKNGKQSSHIFATAIQATEIELELHICVHHTEEKA
jgi:hypothetical protein